MTKRMLISGLWFISMWGVGGAAHFLLDVPRVVMLIPAIAIAVAVWIALARHDAWLETRHADENGTSRHGVESTVGVPALQA
jgi:hypothetical protein